MTAFISLSRRPLVVAALASPLLLAGCEPAVGPRDRVEAFMGATFEGDAAAVGDMLLLSHPFDEEDSQFFPLDELGDVVLEFAADKGDEGETLTAAEAQEWKEKFTEMYLEEVMKVSEVLSQKGELAGIDTELVESNGDWACVDARYRFADGTTLARLDGGGDDGEPKHKEFKPSDYVPASYSFLHRRDGNWYVLSDVPAAAAERFSTTTAAAFLWHVLKGQFAKATLLLDEVPGSGGAESRNMFAALASARAEHEGLMEDWSLSFAEQQDAGSRMLVSYTIKITDEVDDEHSVRTDILVESSGDTWRVHRAVADSEIAKLSGLSSKLIASREQRQHEEAQRELQQDLLAQQREAEAQRLARERVARLLEDAGSANSDDREPTEAEMSAAIRRTLAGALFDVSVQKLGGCRKQAPYDYYCRYRYIGVNWGNFWKDNGIWYFQIVD